MNEPDREQNRVGSYGSVRLEFMQYLFLKKVMLCKSKNFNFFLVKY